MKRLLFILAALLVAGGALAGPAPEPLKEVAPEWREIGSAKMRWFGLHIYDITLWSAAARFDEKQPYALNIQYARNIPGENLASTSIDEMKKLGFRDEAQLTRWHAALNKVFPDVKPGEQILGIHLPGTGARFFHQGKATGSLDDAQLARAFFAIWMDEKTSEPALRAKLLGGK